MAIQQILISTKTDRPPFLLPGQLAYSYKSGTLFIGPPTPESGSGDVIEITRGNILIDYIDQTDTFHTPNSSVIYREIKQKLDTIEPFANFNKLKIEDSNNSIFAVDVKNIKIDTDSGFIYTAINNNIVTLSLPKLFQSISINTTQSISPLNNLDTFKINSNQNKLLLNVINNELHLDVKTELSITPTTQDDLIPSIKVVKDEINKMYSSIQSSIVRYIFSDPTLDCLIVHNKNTNIFDVNIKSIIDNQIILAPIEIIDDNSFIIHFTEEESCIVDVRF